MPMSSIVLASSVPATMGAMAIAITFSVQSGSSLAKGSQSGFQLPLARLRSMRERGRRCGISRGFLFSTIMVLSGLRVEIVAEHWFGALDVLQVRFIGASGHQEHGRGEHAEARHGGQRKGQPVLIRKEA